MRAPPLLPGAALLLWGTCSGHVWLAAALALVLEGVQRVPQRWALARRDFEQLADLSSLALAGALSWLLAQSRHFPNSLASVLAWLPAFYFALILAQRASTAQRVPLSALFWSLRKRAPAAESGVALDYGYAALCVLSAAAANLRAVWFFPAVCVLCIYALWPARARRVRLARWGAMCAAAAGLAFVLQAALAGLQHKVEEAVLEWLTARWDAQADPYRAHTAIGDVGRVKLSDRIVLRVRMPEAGAAGQSAPLLRTASYQRFTAGGWLAREQNFARLQDEGARWAIAAGAGRPVEVSAWLTAGRALLALPGGTYRLDGLRVERAERNALGALRVAEGPDPLFYRAWFDAAAATDAPPQSDDLDVPDPLHDTLEQVAREIGAGDDAGGFAERTRRFFAERFRYSLSLTSATGEGRDLARFLLQERHGHCEYFATATALLLRHAGIPTRYAVGYAVHEYSPLEGQYVVRRRDAHAWTLVWLGGRWVDVDTTPGTWYAEEAQERSLLQPVSDLFSWINYRLAAWRTAEGERSDVPMLVLAGMLAALLAWRLYRQRVPVMRPAAQAKPVGAGVHSALQPLLDELARHGCVRRADVPLLRWVRELPLNDEETRAMLLQAVRLHYALRFGAGVVQPVMQQRLQARVNELIERLQAASRRSSA
jgi:hypothetical protein